MTAGKKIKKCLTNYKKWCIIKVQKTKERTQKMIIRWKGLYVGFIPAEECDVQRFENAGFTVEIKGV